mgnify:CR=1 FL=1
MLLRKRLTLINIFLVGGIFLLFGALVYQLISVTLIFQIDRQLKEAAVEALEQVSEVPGGQFGLREVEEIKLEEGYYYQIWTREKRLLRSSDNLEAITPLYVSGFGLQSPEYVTAEAAGRNLRVVSVPLQVGKRPVGTLMIGSDLSLVQLIQRYILTVLGWGVGAAVIIVGLVVWWSTYRALEPLEQVSATAIQITKADDLARRIPYRGPQQDEVGQLIQAFNQTLAQVEDLLNTQRQFISDVSHELRTPLTVIKGNLDLLREIECIEEESFEIINSEVHRLARMVNDLLMLAQADSGQLPLKMQPVALDTLLLEVFPQALTLAEGEVEVEIGELDQVQILGDGDRLKQVLINLISNAIKYTPPGGKVELDLGKNEDEGEAYFSIADNGPGISEEDLPHIFKRFYRTEKARTRSKDSGFGLGLSIAHWIVQNHGGDIEVESEPGQGTIFTVRLPLAGEHVGEA